MADLGLVSDNYSCIIMQDVYECLDQDTALRYHSRIELKRELGILVTEDLESLAAFIRSEVTTLDFSASSTIPGPGRKSAFPGKSVNALYNPENFAGTKHDSQFNKSKCELGCETEHRLIDFTIYVNMSLEEKQMFIRTTLRCFICLGKNHAARNCPKRKDNWKFCRQCQYTNHHWTICPQIPFHQQATPVQPQSVTQPLIQQPFSVQQQAVIQSHQPSNLDANVPPYHPASIQSNENNVTAKGINTAALHSNTANQECEETAEYRNNDLNPKDYSPLVLVEVENGDGNWIKAKCFLDTGSNSSLVRMKFARQSRLQGNGPSSVQFGIAGGGIHYEQAEEFDIRIRPLQEEKSYLVKTIGIKKPCFNVKPIPQNIFSEHKHLQGVRDKIYVGGGEVD